MVESNRAQDTTYSGKIAVIYLFNLIVGVGGLALPKAFAKTGWILGIVALAVLGLMSYCTSTFMIEAMSIGNAVLKLKDRKKIPNAIVSGADQPMENNASYEDSGEGTSLLINSNEEDKLLDDDLYAINKKVEMGELAELFFNKAGLIAYYIVIALYLYGDLAIYAAAVPTSLTKVICGGDDPFKHASEQCENVKSNMSVFDMYRIMLLVFTACLCPFVFFNLAKTKFLQIATTIFRWAAFLLMVTLAFLRIGKGKSTHHAEVFDFNNLPEFFGVAVYSFMCQHSLPSIITPVKEKKRINFIVFLDFVAVAGFYALLVLTAVFAYTETEINGLYTLTFTKNDAAMFFVYFLELFPVFTLTTNFPIIGITLRENLKTLFLKKDKEYGLFANTFLFPLVTVIPPIIIAFSTYDVELLVSFTGSYAGAVIQYIIPVLLVFYGRRFIREEIGGYKNSFRSPFRQQFWIFLIILWYVICLVLVTWHIITKYS